jgi:hypothetical protein
MFPETGQLSRLTGDAESHCLQLQAPLRLSQCRDRYQEFADYRDGHHDREAGHGDRASRSA